MLFKAFVYTCNIGNNDFITPIVSFFSQFKNFKETNLEEA